MDTNAIINAAMQQLVDTVADAVIRKLKAEATAVATLEPEKLQLAVLHLLETDTLIREEVRDIITDTTSEFQDLQGAVESLQERLDEIEATPVDADNSDFQDAVRSVIRNHI